MRIVVLDPENGDPTWAPLESVVVMDVVDPEAPGDPDIDVPSVQEQIRYINEDPDYLRLDIRVSHVLRAEDVEEKPCPDCGVYPGDPHNPEAHIAEMRAAERRMYEPDEFLEAEYEDRYPSDDT